MSPDPTDAAPAGPPEGGAPGPGPTGGATGSTGGGEARRLGALGKIALVVLPLPLLLLVVEGMLFTLDLGRHPWHQGLSRGFDPGARQIVADRSERGAWRTNIHGAGKEVVIPPRDGRRRVLLFGGSNTQLFPERVLQDALDEAEPDTWEVVNLGRSGYGARRVRNLMEQVLPVLEPDVVLIYSGHNEFIERVFEAEVQELWEADWQRDLAETFSGLRLFGALVEALAPLEPPPSIDRIPPAERNIGWEQTLAFYDAYEQQLADMCAMATDAGAQVVLCTLVGNPLAPPFVDTWNDGIPPDKRERFDELRRKAQSHLPKQARQSLHPPRRLRVADWFDLTKPREEPWEPTLRTMLGALGETPVTAWDKGASVEGAHWPDPARWDDEVVAVLETMDFYTNHELTADEAQRLERARRWIDQATELVPDHPKGWFDKGLVCWLQRDLPAAVEAFDKAASWDRSPSSANERIHAIVRRVAEAHADDGVTYLDVSRWFREHCPDGLVGYEVMMDVCHIQPGARVPLMHLFADTLRALPADRSDP